MWDQVLSLMVVILPTLFAIGIEVVPEKIKKHLYWPIGVVAFGVGLSVLTGFQMFRANKIAAADRQSAIVETSQRVSESVSESVSRSVTKSVSEQYTQTINGLQLQIGTLEAQLTAQGRKVDVIRGSNIVTGKEPIKVEVTNQPPGAPAGPAVRVSRMFVTPRPQYGKMAMQFILTTDRVMNGGKALLHCQNKINNGTAQISGASITAGGGGMQDQNTFKAWIDAPNWAPSSPLVITLYFDEPDLGKCDITLLE
jgi:hypothetical protein